ncbi:MAG: Xaa-Pro peptidase family protein [Vulcanisaeta sp.]|nr:Xaa-Pro peptidase family protein [Vulcanisaeta sp.]MCG2892661.1 Xaa-Pro peptidase family protein [Vulcanisaeta sp.]
MHEIPTREFERRLNELYRVMERRGLSAVYLVGAVNIAYFTGFYYLQTERPLAIVIRSNGDVFFFGPLLERDHALYQSRLIMRTYVYRDYPGETHPMKLFAEWLKELHLDSAVIGYDVAPGYVGYWGYKGPSLTELLPNAKFVSIADEIYAMRVIKSDVEIELLRESAKWANLAHSLLQDYTAPGLYDYEVSLRASLDASVIMKKALGPNYRPLRSEYPAYAGFRGQVGEHGAFPHSISVERPIRVGDVLVTGATADISGYMAELERNLFVGEPPSEVIKYHKIALKLQEAALNALRPGVKASDVDRAVIKAAKELGVYDYLLHHSGHGLGLEAHEAPFLDVGDDTVLRPGMVVTVEPGIYVPKLGGFRHSDTVVIRDDGIEVITYYPRDTESLIVEV